MSNSWTIEEKVIFIPSKTKTKKDSDEPALVRVAIRKLHLLVKGTHLTFGISQRGGVFSFSDSRNTKNAPTAHWNNEFQEKEKQKKVKDGKSLSIYELTKELTRMMGEKDTNEILQTIGSPNISMLNFLQKVQAGKISVDEAEKFLQQRNVA